MSGESGSGGASARGNTRALKTRAQSLDGLCHAVFVRSEVYAQFCGSEQPSGQRAKRSSDELRFLLLQIQEESELARASPQFFRRQSVRQVGSCPRLRKGVTGRNDGRNDVIPKFGIEVADSRHVAIVCLANEGKREVEGIGDFSARAFSLKMRKARVPSSRVRAPAARLGSQRQFCRSRAGVEASSAAPKPPAFSPGAPPLCRRIGRKGRLRSRTREKRKPDVQWTWQIIEGMPRSRYTMPLVNIGWRLASSPAMRSFSRGILCNFARQIAATKAWEACRWRSDRLSRLARGEIPCPGPHPGPPRRARPHAPRAHHRVRRGGVVEVPSRGRPSRACGGLLG